MLLHATAEHAATASGRGPQSRRSAGLKLAITAGLFAVGCGPGEDPELVAGRTLYDENCQMCHGDSALGDGPMASSLPVPPVNLMEHLGHHTMAELTRLVTGGIPPAMPPAPVDADELRLIVDYLWTLVPEDEVEALRDMQRQMEMMGSGAMPGMEMDSSGSATPEG